MPINNADHEAAEGTDVKIDFNGSNVIYQTHTNCTARGLGEVQTPRQVMPVQPAGVQPPPQGEPVRPGGRCPPLIGGGYRSPLGGGSGPRPFWGVNPRRRRFVSGGG